MPVHWSATMISPPRTSPERPCCARRSSSRAATATSIAADLHVSACGIFTATLDGQPVADDVLSPGWTSYEWRLRYRTYDVTRLLAEGSVLGLALGNGWYRGRLAWSADRVRCTATGSAPSPSWRSPSLTATVSSSSPTTPGGRSVGGPGQRPVRRPDHRRPARRRLVDCAPVPRAEGWGGVEVLDFDHGLLAPYVGPVVTPPGELDAGRGSGPSPPAGPSSTSARTSSAGSASRVHGEAGHVVTLRHAEVLEHGELGIRPLRTAEATDRFVLSGGDDVFEPTLTFHGFRYVEVDGLAGRPRPPVPSQAVVVHSDLRRTGTFECSDALLNQLHRNVVWGLRGNFLDVPTDCPQRDERLGLDRRHRGVRPDGGVPLRRARASCATGCATSSSSSRRPTAWCRSSSPTCSSTSRHPVEFADPDSTAIWSDAAVWVPWALWQAYGDLDVLAAPVRLDGRARAPRRVAALADRAVGRELPVRGLARPAARRRTHPSRPRPTTEWSPPRACTAARAWSPRAAVLLGQDQDAADFSRARRPDPRARSTSTTSADDGDDPERRRHRLRAGDRLRPARRRAAPTAPATGSPSLVAEAATTSPPGSPARPTSADALTLTGSRRRGLPAAPRADLPVLALPGDDGRHHDLGAVGLDAPGRQPSTRAR